MVNEELSSVEFVILIKIRCFKAYEGMESGEGNHDMAHSWLGRNWSLQQYAGDGVWPQLSVNL